MKTQLEKIYSVFQNTEIDALFIEVATNLGWSDYFMNLDLDENDEIEVAKCYGRVMTIVNSIPMSMLPEDLLNDLK
jgi:hypothetical protein